MTKRRWSLVLVVAGVIVASGFGIAHHWLQDPPLGYYLHWTHRKCLLPEEYIRPAFRHMTEREMPQVADNAQAIWFGSREPHIFVRFETDANGIAHIERAFNIPGAKCRVFDAERVRGLVQSGVTLEPALRYLTRIVSAPAGKSPTADPAGKAGRSTSTKSTAPFTYMPGRTRRMPVV